MAANETEATGVQKPAGGGKKKLFFILGGVVIIGAAVAALFLLGVIGGSSEAAPAEEVETIKAPAKPRPTVALEEFVVNLADTDQPRFLKTAIELEAANEEVAKGCEASRAAIRNSVVELLSSKTFAQIRDVKGKARLRQEIIVRLNEILGTNGVTQVYFTDFIVQ
ncbi:flagellar basal body-associated FliL family protein [bacterium]|nr:flagellar basal body-associated FliL family protein [bacterium]